MIYVHDETSLVPCGGDAGGDGGESDARECGGDRVRRMLTLLAAYIVLLFPKSLSTCCCVRPSLSWVVCLVLLPDHLQHIVRIRPYHLLFLQFGFSLVYYRLICGSSQHLRRLPCCFCCHCSKHVLFLCSLSAICVAAPPSPSYLSHTVELRVMCRLGCGCSVRILYWRIDKIGKLCVSRTSSNASVVDSEYIRHIYTRHRNVLASWLSL